MNVVAKADLHYWLNERVHLLRGPEAGAIYDLRNRKLYRIDLDACSLLEGLPASLSQQQVVRWDDFLQQALARQLLSCGPTPPSSAAVSLPAVLNPPRIDQVWLELTNQCNQRCRHCYMGHELGDEPMPVEQVLATLSEISKSGIKKLYFCGGEPMMHPQIRQILQSALAGDFEQIVILTNGTKAPLWLEEIVQDPRVILKIPVFGDHPVHDRFVQLPKSLFIIRRHLARFKKWGADVQLCTTISNYNKDQVPFLLAFSHEYGYPIHRAALFPVGFARDNWSELVEDYSELLGQCGDSVLDDQKSVSAGYQQSGERYPYMKLSGSLSSGHECNTSLAIQASGLVTPCLMVREERYAFGRIQTKSLAEMINPDSLDYQRLSRFFSHENNTSCMSCEVRYGCQGGGCPVLGMFFDGLDEPDRPPSRPCHYPSNKKVAIPIPQAH